MSKELDERKVNDPVADSLLHKALDESELDSSVAKKYRSPRQPLSTLSKTCLVVLLVLTTLMAAFGLFIHQTIVLAIAGIMLLISSLIVAKFRWAPLLASIIGGLVLFIFTVVTEYPLYHLSHPKDVYGAGVLTWLSFFMFIVMVALFWCSAMLVVTGIAAIIQNYIQRERRTPSWFNTALGVAVGIFLGAILLGSLNQPPSAAATNTNTTPTVHLGAGAFSQSSITISKGSRLILIDDGAYHHTLSNGIWKSGQPVFENQSGEPLIKNQDINASGASLAVGPFNTAGTYHLFCSIHEGMTLTITVQ